VALQITEIIIQRAVGKDYPTPVALGDNGTRTGGGIITENHTRGDGHGIARAGTLDDAVKGDVVRAMQVNAVLGNYTRPGWIDVAIDSPAGGNEQCAAIVAYIHHPAGIRGQGQIARGANAWA
jgi:hypothetical protein